MSGCMDWLQVDPIGLAQQLEKKGKAWIIYELWQNAVDEAGVTKVAVTLEPIPNRPVAKLRVEDDGPEGFRNLSHAYTLFASSYKKDNPEQRGVFNVGEKFVLALCNQATITTTKGTVVFDKSGRRTTRVRREAGSVFEAEVRITRDEIHAVLQKAKLLIPVSGITTTINGEPLVEWDPEATFEASLPTVIADEQGNLTNKTIRKTMVEVYLPYNREPAYLYEMGIPIVETGDKYHINVLQKIPLNMQRDNVTPSYLRKVRTLVVNAMHKELTTEDANQPWARNALQDKDISPEAVETSLTLRFGDKRAIFDPTDHEANKRFVAEGGTIIHGSQLSKAEWDNVKKTESAMPAGQLTPSPKPYSNHGDPINIVPEEKWTKDQEVVVDYIMRLHDNLLDCSVGVTIVNDIKAGFGACYSRGKLDLNLGRLGHKWFKEGANGFLLDINDLLIHEFAHYYSGDHLSTEFHRALCKLGAAMTNLALHNPDLFDMRQS